MTAMVTPFDDDLEIDFKAVERIVDHLISSGTDTIVVAGSTGESPTLEDYEKKELLKAVKARAKERAKIIMGTGYNSTAKTIKACQEVEALGADGLLVVAPYYNKPNQEGLRAHFEQVSRATRLPIVVYNIPGRTGVNISSDTIIELAKRSHTIHALKDSTNSVEQAADIAGQAREDFRIYSGDDFLTLPFLSIGACGVVSVASHIAGPAIRKLIDAFFAGRHDEARSLHYEYLSLFKGLFAAPNPTCIKYALAKLGFCKEHLRLPLVALDAKQKETMDALLKKYKAAVTIPTA
jgi:4-hydroxy-tetrahydrodipicolinate synthase